MFRIFSIFIRNGETGQEGKEVRQEKSSVCAQKKEEAEVCVQKENF